MCMNLLEQITYQQDMANCDVLLNHIEYLYKEYRLNDYCTMESATTDVPEHTVSGSELQSKTKSVENSKSNKIDEDQPKTTVGSKIIAVIKKIFDQICKVVKHFITRVFNRRTRMLIGFFDNLKSTDYDNLQKGFQEAAEKVKGNQGQKVGTKTVQEFGDVGFANMKDVSKFVDIDQYEARMKEIRNNPLQSQMVGHMATAAGVTLSHIAINPVVSAAATTIFTGYSVYALMCTLGNIVKYMKLAVNKRSVYGYIPSMDKIKEAVIALNNKLKGLNIILPGNLKRITAIRAGHVLDEIKVHDATYHPVFRQCEYFYDKEIKGSGIMSSKLEDKSVDLNATKLKRSETRAYCECVNFVRGIDLPMERLFKEFEKNAQLVSQSLSSNTMKKETKSDPLLGELMRSSKDGLKMIKMFNDFSTIAGDTVKLLHVAMTSKDDTADNK